MPKSLPGVDWELIKALYLQGLTIQAISNRTGVKPASIKSRCHYHQWQLTRAKAVHGFQASLQPSIPHSQALAFSKQSTALAKASQIAQETFAAELSDQASILRFKRPTKLRDLANTPAREGRASVVQKLVNTAAKLYGWDAQSQQPQTLNLTQVNVRSADDLPAGAKIIDAPTE